MVSVGHGNSIIFSMTKCIFSFALHSNPVKEDERV